MIPSGQIVIGNTQSYANLSILKEIEFDNREKVGGVCGRADSRKNLKSWIYLEEEEYY